MDNYELEVGEVFTQQKADELIEYLRAKDAELRDARKKLRQIKLIINMV